MSQDAGDPIIANPQETLSISRPKIVAAIQALRSLQSGASDPTYTIPHMLVARTDAAVVKQRDAADAAYVNLWPLGAGPVACIPYAKVFADSPITIDQPGVYYCDATAGNIALTLPDAASSSGWFVAIVKTDSSANTVTLNRAGTDTIEGATSVVLSAQYDKTAAMSDSSATWYKFPGV